MSLRLKIFCHSIASDWNHGNAHFLRGILTEFAQRGFSVESLEPEDSWSRENLVREYGPAPVEEFEKSFPRIPWRTYNLQRDRLEDLAGDADIVLVHEWNTPELIAGVGELRSNNPGLRIFFHDTHHRAVTAPEEMRLNALEHYDGILVYGRALAEAYGRLGWTDRLHVWHEAADTRIFKPRSAPGPRNGLVWLGNWGDNERTRELEEFLVEPVAQLKLRSAVYGVRYPRYAIERLAEAGIEYRGWLANYLAPNVFANYQLTVHVPRRPYVEALPGIPTIRPFEAMACCLPLICSPWSDTEGLFRKGEDYLQARNGTEMTSLIREVTNDEKLAAWLGRNGLATIQARHTCTHRVDELLQIYNRIRPAEDRKEAVACT